MGAVIHRVAKQFLARETGDPANRLVHAQNLAGLIGFGDADIHVIVGHRQALIAFPQLVFHPPVFAQILEAIDRTDGNAVVIEDGIDICQNRNAGPIGPFQDQVPIAHRPAAAQNLDHRQFVLAERTPIFLEQVAGSPVAGYIRCQIRRAAPHFGRAAVKSYHPAVAIADADRNRQPIPQGGRRPTKRVLQNLKHLRYALGVTGIHDIHMIIAPLRAPEFFPIAQPRVFQINNTYNPQVF